MHPLQAAWITMQLTAELLIMEVLGHLTSWNPEVML